MKPRIKSPAIRVKVWPVLYEAVDSGAMIGWHRAHKHDDKPSDETIREHIVDGVMTEISERFDFDTEWGVEA